MSNGKAAPPQEFDFWEYVACSRCHLFFTPDSGGPPPVPFWITECGHVICNNHLKADQSCAKCGEKEVQVAPLQREMEPPMANWFTSVPQAFDALAYTTRFQIESLASLVRYYKRKCAHQRTLLDRMKVGLQENKDLRRTVEMLQAENQQLQGYLGEASDMPNSNGKRRMLGPHRHASGAHTNSSPRSVVTPLAPQRLTLPPSHQQPSFSQRQHHSDDGPQTVQFVEDDDMHEPMDARRRPGSRQFMQQYAYNPQQPQQSKPMHPPRLAHAQVRHQQQSSSRNFAHIPSRSKEGTFSPSILLSGPSGQPISQDIDDSQMPPPPVPQANPGVRNQSQQSTFIPPSTPRGSGPSASQSLNRRLLNATPMPQRTVPGPSNTPSTGFRTATPALQTQRFMPGTPSARQRFGPPNATAGPSGLSAGPLRSGNAGGTGQRMPFMPSG